MAGRSQSQNTDKPRFGYFVSMSIPKPYNESSLSLTSSHSAWLASMNVGRLDLDELVSGMSINSTKAKQRLDDMLIKHINPPPHLIVSYTQPYTMSTENTIWWCCGNKLRVMHILLNITVNMTLPLCSFIPPSNIISSIS